jgi:hypothetical protein
MPAVSVRADQVRVGDRFAVAFQRTLRIPEDGRVYPLPPGLGRLPVAPIEELGDAAPVSPPADSAVFIPLYQREALWLAFEGTDWKPNAVQVAVGGVNAVSGEPWEERLADDPQNYLVCPNQPWLDGINAGEGFVRQFVAVPLGSGATVEGRLTGREEVGGIQIRVYEPKPGVFSDQPPPQTEELPVGRMKTPGLGLGAGGQIRQKIYPDPHGLDVWDPDGSAVVFVQLLNSEQYRALTGHHPPPTVIDVATYIEQGLPWLELYDEGEGDVPAPADLAGVEGTGASRSGD